MRPRPGNRPTSSDALFVGTACTLVFVLFLALTLGGAQVGYARQEKSSCLSALEACHNGDR